jgi:hypothetical protein
LIARLKACPARDASITRERFLEGWETLRREEVTSKPSLPILAALVLQDDRFAQLLNEVEQAQLLTLVNRALDRYEQETNPPNKLGKLIAGSLKKESP